MKSRSNILLLLAAAVVVVAGVYFWRKKAAHKATCQEICFSTGEEKECDVVCTPPAA
jgi:hypothetical protein